MKLKPLHDWAVIKRLNAEEKTSGGIIIPASAQEKPSEGVVIRIGPGRYKMEKGRLKFTPTTIKPGQRVFYPEYSATEVELDGREFTLVREEDILGTYEENEIVKKQSFDIVERREYPVAVKKESIPVVTPLKKKAAEKKKAKRKAAKGKKASSKALSKTKAKKAAKKKNTKPAKKAARKAVKKEAKKAAIKKKAPSKGKKQTGK